MLARGLDFLRLDEYSRIPLSFTVATLDGWVGDSSFALHDFLFLNRSDVAITQANLPRSRKRFKNNFEKKKINFQFVVLSPKVYPTPKAKPS